MKKFITSFLLLILGATCFGAVAPYPEREITIEVASSVTYNVYKTRRPDPVVAAACESLVRTATTHVEHNGGETSPGIKFNMLPLVSLPVLEDAHLSPSTEADLTYIFQKLYWGKPQMEFEKPWRTLFVHFMHSVPAASALTSGAYQHGSHKGISWVYPSSDGWHEVCFAVGASPQNLNQEDFEEAFRQYFAQRHGVSHELPGTLDETEIGQLRTALLSQNGVGCFEPIVTCQIETNSRTKENKFRIWYRDLIPRRCYRLEQSVDCSTWTELWFTSYDTDAPRGSLLSMAGKPKMFYRYSLCKEK
jgi:hypothetical protein